jgi:predicted metal-dependent phosphoesterase TrpH
MFDLELHCHTRYSPDSLTKLEDLIAHARAAGLSYLAITDHSEVKGGLLAKKMAPDLIITGEEAMTDQGELLCYFITELIPRGLTISEAARRVHAQGGICGPSHPFDPNRYGIGGANIRKHAHELDFVEVFNARTRDDSKNTLANEIALELGLPRIVASDAHTLREVGVSRVRVGSPITNAQDFLAALKEPQAELITHHSPVTVHVESTFATMARKMGLDRKP